MRAKMNCVFNGRSREMTMNFSNDHQPSREAIVAETRRKRESRDRERRRNLAAQRIQRSARRWIARALLAACAAGAIRAAMATTTAAGARRGLARLCWDFEFIRRSPRRHEADMGPFADVLRRALVRAMRSSTLEAELCEASHAKELCVCVLLDAYARAPNCAMGSVDGAHDEESDEAPPIPLLRALLVVASRLPGRAVLLPPLLRFAVRCDAALRPPIAALVRETFASFTDADVSAFSASASGSEALHGALASTAPDEPFAAPTAVALDVLIGPSRSEGPEVRGPEVRGALFASVIRAVAEGLAAGAANSAIAAQPLVALGKLVRLMPAIEEHTDLRREWLTCMSMLAFRANRKNEFMRATLHDLFRPCVVETTGHSSGADPTRGRECYEHGSTYLFSADYGLQLLADCATASLRAGFGASYAELDLLCSIYAWPLYSFGVASPEQRIELNTIVSRLVSKPGLLRSLWCAYQMVHYGRTFDDTSESVRDRILRGALTGEAIHVPFHVNVPSENFDAMSGTKVAIPRSLFRDSYPAISTLLFTLMKYFFDATNIKEGSQQNAVMSSDDVVFLVLALKSIIHQAHFNGIAADANSEAVVQTALTLLTKLHVINETQPFIEHPSVWITTADEPIFSVFYSIIPDVYTSVAAARNAILHAMEDEEDDGKGIEAAHSSPAHPYGAARTENEGCVVQEMIAYHPQWDGSSMWTTQERCVRLLQNAPFTIPFKVRAAVFTNFLLTRHDRFFGSYTVFYVKRGDVFPGTFDKFSMTPETSDLFSVRFVDANNHVEEGYGEGVYREFLVSLCTEGFAAERGLFRLTDDGFLYPNPFSFESTGDPHHLQKIRFLGAMVGRALRDGILQDVPFALHFRNVILGRRNPINILKSFDHQLYHHLISLNSLSAEEIDALALNFAYTHNELGMTSEVELVRGGRDIPVTRGNCLHYIHHLADFKLNRESARQTEAFLSGLKRIVDHSWIQIFDSQELMKLFGGDAEGGINIEDWKSNTQYNSPSDEQSTPVRVFWQVVGSMSSDQQKKLLKFATSMNRPPLLGFRFLNPQFKLHVVWGESEQRLPSSSTCFSTLKIPPYSEVANARSKIIAAIEETADFGLS